MSLSENDILKFVLHTPFSVYCRARPGNLWSWQVLFDVYVGPPIRMLIAENEHNDDYYFAYSTRFKIWI